MPVAKVGFSLPTISFPVPAPQSYLVQGRKLDLANHKRHRVRELSRSKRKRFLTGILDLIIRTVSKSRYPYFTESNLTPPDGITPQDLLS